MSQKTQLLHYKMMNKICKIRSVPSDRDFLKIDYITIEGLFTGSESGNENEKDQRTSKNDQRIKDKQ